MTLASLFFSLSLVDAAASTHCIAVKSGSAASVTTPAVLPHADTERASWLHFGEEREREKS
jgi:hypothetical protein